MKRGIVLLAALLVFGLAVMGTISTVGLVFSIRGSTAAVKASNAATEVGDEVKTLLLNGKTASAKSAKKTSLEVETLTRLVQGLKDVQAFDHRQTENQLRAQTQGNKIIAEAIAQIESHLDATIARDIAQAEMQAVANLPGG